MKFLHLPSYSVFDYKPRYFDNEKEERKNRLNKLRNSLGKSPVDVDKDNVYVPGSSIKGSFRSKISTNKRSSRHLIRILIIVALISFVLYLQFFTRVGSHLGIF